MHFINLLLEVMLNHHWLSHCGDLKIIKVIVNDYL